MKMKKSKTRNPKSQASLHTLKNLVLPVNVPVQNSPAVRAKVISLKNIPMAQIAK
jgi:hypothetical protein